MPHNTHTLTLNTQHTHTQHFGEGLPQIDVMQTERTDERETKCSVVQKKTSSIKICLSDRSRKWNRGTGSIYYGDCVLLIDGNIFSFHTIVLLQLLHLYNAGWSEYICPSTVFQMYSVRYISLWPRTRESGNHLQKQLEFLNSEELERVISYKLSCSDPVQKRKRMHSDT